MCLGRDHKQREGIGWVARLSWGAEVIGHAKSANSRVLIFVNFIER